MEKHHIQDKDKPNTPKATMRFSIDIIFKSSVGNLSLFCKNAEKIRAN